MTILEIILASSLATSIILLGVSIYFNVKHGLLILKFIDSTEKSLDMLDERYAKISDILTIPLFYDSPQIRDVLKDIKACRDTVLITANLLANVEEINAEEEV
jgi:hypothetical protein|tara:strand:+ start:510 stop:818 length:309 start_codon:yes stop_codon:yes gene_type:complete